MELAKQLTEDYRVIIIADVVDNNIPNPSSLITIKKWPSKKLKRMDNFLFLIKEVWIHRPIMMISNFSSVNLFLTVGYLFRIKNRIAWCHSISEQFLPKRPLLDHKKLIYSLATTIVANSNSTKKDLVKTFSVPESKIKVYYNAVRKRRLAAQNVEKNQIVYAGRMDSSKGVETLINSMSEVLNKFPALKLKLIGGNLGGGEIRRLKELAKLADIEKSLFFLGNKSKEFVLEEFSKSYVTIVPSILEAFGYVVIESFSVKTPVIGSSTTGIAEIIRDGVDGFLFKTRDYGDLSKKLIELLNNEELRSQFSENCYERFSDMFELEKVISELKEDLQLMNL